MFRQLHHEALENSLSEVSNKHPILEIACGTGHTTDFLVNHGFNVIACDLTPGMMDKVEEQVGDSIEQVTFVQANAFKLPFPDNSFSAMVSTRFLHLFPVDEQALLLKEIIRVLKPGATMVIDYDNWTHRWLWSIPFLLYNLVRYRRMAPYSIYNKIKPTERMFEQLGVRDVKVLGVGGAQILPASFISRELALSIGRMHFKSPLRTIADQFMIEGTKK